MDSCFFFSSISKPTHRFSDLKANLVICMPTCIDGCNWASSYILIKQHIGILNLILLQNKLLGQFMLRLDCGRMSYLCFASYWVPWILTALSCFKSLTLTSQQPLFCFPVLQLTVEVRLSDLWCWICKRNLAFANLAFAILHPHNSVFERVWAASLCCYAAWSILPVITWEGKKKAVSVKCTNLNCTGVNVLLKYRFCLSSP